LPFTATTQLRDFLHDGDTVAGGAGLSALTVIEARCRPPVVNAWRSKSEHQGAWAVTVGTNMEGYSEPGPGCVDNARRRLAGSVGLGLVALGAGVFLKRAMPIQGSTSEARPEPPSS
jgi:hypothetical protein